MLIPAASGHVFDAIKTSEGMHDLLCYEGHQEFQLF
jgi:hypothetical protein